MTSTLEPRTMLAAVAAGLLAALGPWPTAASAQSGGGATPAIQYHAAFSGGQSTGFTVGTVVDVRYVDPSGQTTERQFCWNPAPIDRPACDPTGTGAPAKAGTQTVTATLNNGRSLSTTFPVGAANVNLGTGTGAFTPPVPYTANCAMVLSADAQLKTPLDPVSVGQQLAGYYSPRRGVTQVYDYATNTAGFFPSACLTAPTAPIKAYSRTVKLHSNRTSTYTLSLPRGFKPGTTQPGGTAIGYALYQGDRVGTGIGFPITSTARGAHQPFLGATVTRSTYKGNAVSVTVKTTRLANPITLKISASGTA